MCITSDNFFLVAVDVVVNVAVNVYIAQKYLRTALVASALPACRSGVAGTAGQGLFITIAFLSVVRAVAWDNPMDDFEDCALVFGADIDKPYQKEVLDEIIRHRQDLEDQLFIDRLLGALGIDDGEAFTESRYIGLVLYVNSSFLPKHLDSTLQSRGWS